MVMFLFFGEYYFAWSNGIDNFRPIERRTVNSVIILIRFVQEFVKDDFLLDLANIELSRRDVNTKDSEIEDIKDLSNYIIIQEILKTKYKHLY